MVSVSQPLQTRLDLFLLDKNVTEDLMPDLLSFSYKDKETNEADEISITLKDEKGKWADTWKPDGGEAVKAYIIPGTIRTPGQRLYCGKFFVDGLHVSGSPRIFEMNAVSIPLNKPIRKKLKSKAWEKRSLKSIAQEIAKNAGISLLFDSKINPTYDRQDQKKESDLKFLSRLCEEEGLSLKVTDEKIVLFDQSFYEGKAPIKTLTLGSSYIKSWDFDSAQSETYKSCTVTYRDPKQKKKGKAGSYDMNMKKVKATKVNEAVMSYTYTDPDAEENGQEYEIKKRAKSLSDAKRIAKAKLRNLNMRRVTGNMTLIGDTSLVAGVVINIKGFGSFDGNFIINESEHTIDSAGYNTQVVLRRVNNKY